MRYFEVEGNSPEEILNTFLTQRKIPQEFVEMEILDPGAKGFIGIGKKPAKVKLIFNESEYIVRKSRLFLSDMLDKGGFDYHIEVKEDGAICTLNILSEDSSVLIGRSASMLDSLQYIMDRVIRGEDSKISVLVDVDSYRERVVGPLKEKAIRMANSVAKSGRSIKMPPMATMIRREIHMVVKAIPGVSTISHGDGQLKSITIISEKNRKGPQPKDDRVNSKRGPRSPNNNRNRRRPSNSGPKNSPTDGEK